MHKVKKLRFYLSLAGLAAIVAFILYVPLPYSVISTLEVRVYEADHVYVKVPGILKEICVKPGQTVKAGQPLARLISIDLKMKLDELEGKKKQYETHLKDLEEQRHENESVSMKASAEIQELRENLAKTIQLIDELQEEDGWLTLTASKDGVVIPPPWRPNKPGPEGQLPSWYGTPLEHQNIDVTLEEGTVFCLIGDPKKMEAILYVDQGDIEFVHADQDVEIKLDELPFETFPGTIQAISANESKYSPERLSTKAGGEIATTTDPSGMEKPMSTAFQARVLMDNPSGQLLRNGLRGRAKIEVAPQTIGQRAKRLLSQVINFKL